jgi:hypothetical protein
MTGARNERGYARAKLSARDLSGWMTSGKMAALLKGQVELLSARGDDVSANQRMADTADRLDDGRSSIVREQLMYGMNS